MESEFSKSDNKNNNNVCSAWGPCPGPKGIFRPIKSRVHDRPKSIVIKRRAGVIQWRWNALVPLVDVRETEDVCLQDSFVTVMMTAEICLMNIRASVVSLKLY